MDWGCHAYTWLLAGLGWDSASLSAHSWKLNLAHVARNVSQSGIPFPCPSVQKASKRIFFAKYSEIAALLFISGCLVSEKTKGDTWCCSHILLLVPEKGSIGSATSPHKSQEVPSLTNSYPLLKRPCVFNLYTFKLFQSA